MITIKTGDILREQTDALINTVNCVGVMGRGIALQFKKHFPNNFKDYKLACDRNEVRPGKIFIHETGELYPRYIFNFPTKRHWRGESKIEDIEAGMISLTNEIRHLKISSIAIPPLGSGLGGLEWNDVLPIIKKHLSTVTDVDVTIFEPSSISDQKAPPQNIKAPQLTSGRAALISLIDRYLSACLDPEITLLELQKLMYFLQVSGEALRLRYEQADYGPYAPNLSHVLHRLEGHYVSGYGDGRDKPDKKLMLIAGALEEADAMLKKHPETSSNLNKVASLVEGFETPYGLELLATSHWLIKNKKPETVKELFHLFSEWNERKSKFTEAQIDKAYRILIEKGWVNIPTITTTNN